MSRKTLFIILVTLTVLLLVVAVVGKKKGWVGGSVATEVVVTEVLRTTILEKVSASGKIFPETEVKISPDVSGEIIDLRFLEGDSVKKGELILKINPNIYESILLRAEATLNQSRANLANSKARLFQIKSQYDNAKLTFERNQKLFEQKVLSQAEYDNALMAFQNAEGEYDAAQQSVKGAEFSIKSAEATVKEARDNLAFTNVYAPMNGIISALLVKKGERVVGTTQMAGTEMLRIADLNDMEVRVDVSENDILRITVGDTAEIEVDAFIDRKFKGIVTHIANSATSATGAFSLNTDQVTNFTVKIKILKSSYEDLIETNDTPSPFKPGMSASVEIFTSKAENTIALPIQCVTVREDEKDSRKKQEVVFKYDNGKAVMLKVKTGIQDDRNIQIVSGVEEGDEIVSAPYRAISKMLSDGDGITKISEEELLKKEKKSSGN